MPDTNRTLAALLALLADNTAGDITAQTMRDWLVSTYALTGPEIAITGATTATVGQMHACADAGPPANYTLTLPAASGCGGRLLGVRLVPSMTKLVTLDGNGSETIDGALTRVMWAGESAILYCNGSGWVKVAGKTLPMTCQMAPSTTSSVSAATYTKLNLNTVLIDNTGLMADTGNGRISVPRTSTYAVTTVVRGNNLPSAVTQFNGLARKNSNAVTNYVQSECYGAPSGYPIAFSSQPVLFTAGDYMELYIYSTVSITQYSDGTQQGGSMSLVEIPSW